MGGEVDVGGEEDVVGRGEGREGVVLNQLWGDEGLVGCSWAGWYVEMDFFKGGERLLGRILAGGWWLWC